MVFYFSGTGNSYHVAKKLAEGLGEKMIDMARATDGGAVRPASGTVL